MKIRLFDSTSQVYWYIVQDKSQFRWSTFDIDGSHRMTGCSRRKFWFENYREFTTVDSFPWEKQEEFDKKLKEFLE